MPHGCFVVVGPRGPWTAPIWLSSAAAGYSCPLVASRGSCRPIPSIVAASTGLVLCVFAFTRVSLSATPVHLRAPAVPVLLDTRASRPRQVLRSSGDGVGWGKR